MDFFIIAHQRSGSTLLKTLLNQNDNIFIPSESHILVDWSRKNKTSINEEDFELAMKHERLIDWEAPMLIFPKSCSETFNEVLKKQKPITKSKDALIGDKTPEYIDIIPFLEKNFPNAKFVVLKRDIIDVILSLENRGWKGPFLENRITYWCNGEIAINRLLKENSNSVSISYEEIINNTDITIQKILRFLNVEIDLNKTFTKFDTKDNITLNEEKSGIHTSLKHGKIKKLSRRHLINQNEMDYIYNISSFLTEKGKISKSDLFKFYFLKNLGQLIIKIFPENIFPLLIGIRNFFKPRRTFE
ncbi:MAG: sulfotransferase [Pelagibacteraceae bacterium TMED124]|nr:MAG: sulfotransferase [Pelagibacteraceae bacterium TMED124]|tara:strand:+ start:5997 stop:6902 length:906 start_codon:yes stop_codon:yes gene_type:complete